VVVVVILLSFQVYATVQRWPRDSFLSNAYS